VSSDNSDIDSDVKNNDVKSDDNSEEKTEEKIKINDSSDNIEENKPTDSD